MSFDKIAHFLWILSWAHTRNDTIFSVTDAISPFIATFIATNITESLTNIQILQTF